MKNAPKILMVVILLVSAKLPAQTMIKTVAGNGTKAISPITSPLESSVGSPFGVEIAADGSLYICEVANHRILRLDLSTNHLAVVAGTGEQGYSGDGGIALKARLNQPYEIRFASNGDIYFVEMKNHIVRKISVATGIISTVAGTGKKGDSGDGGPATEARLNNPHSIALNDRSLFIADIGNHRIRRIDLASGKIESIAGTNARQLPVDGKHAWGQPVFSPRALFLQGESLWVALRNGHSIWRLDLPNDIWHHVAGTGKQGFTGDGGDAKHATFDGPKGIAIGPAGDIFVADTENQAIRVIDSKTRVISTLAGSGAAAKGFQGDNGLANHCWLNRPHGICIATDGTVYIGDSGNHRVRAVREKNASDQ